MMNLYFISNVEILHIYMLIMDIGTLYSPLLQSCH